MVQFGRISTSVVLAFAGVVSFVRFGLHAGEVTDRAWGLGRCCWLKVAERSNAAAHITNLYLHAAAYAGVTWRLQEQSEYSMTIHPLASHFPPFLPSASRNGQIIEFSELGRRENLSGSDRSGPNTGSLGRYRQKIYPVRQGL